jgi:hypothetical protein
LYFGGISASAANMPIPEALLCCIQRRAALPRDDAKLTRQFARRSDERKSITATANLTISTL